MTLIVEGAVEKPQRFEFADLAGLPGQVPDVSTLVPGRSGGAVRLASILDRVGVRHDATHLTVESSDGSFAASVPLSLVREVALLCYRAGDAALPQANGGPVRMLIPSTVASGSEAIDGCANVKFVGTLTLSVGIGRDTRPSTKRAHEALHRESGHEHLVDRGRIFWDGASYTDLDSWHATAAALRRSQPVLRVEAPGYPPFWAVTRHADVIEIERQHDRFPNTERSVLFPIETYVAQSAMGLIIKSLVHMDGKIHRDHRRLTNDWFKPANLRRLVEARVIELARQFVDRMQGLGGECDFARDVALLYPLHVIMTILGVPESDEPRMLQLTQQLFGNEDLDFAGSDRAEAVIGASLAFKEYFDRITAERRARPVDDIATVIANGRIDGRPLGELEELSYYIIVATAGHDTTSSSLAAGFEALIRNPGQLALLRERPDMIDNAVDEMIRWATPVRHFMRQATEEYVLDGTKIAAGDRLLLSYLSANRDGEVFADPFCFDVARPNADQHLAFGIGVHFCLGAHLARLELRAFFKELLSRLDDVELAGEPEQVTASFVGGLKRLPIRYRLRAAA